MSEKEYAALTGLLSRAPYRSLGRRVAVAIVAVACLFSPYTLLLGVALLTLLLLGIVAPRFLPQTAARSFRDMRLLHDEVVYGVSDEGFWLSGTGFRAEAAWRFLSVWQIRGNWLVLRAHGIPPVYLPLSELRQAGISDAVLALARTHAPQFGGAAAKSRAVAG